METTFRYNKVTPRIGLVLHSIGGFNPAAKDACEASYRRYFTQLVDSGQVDRGSIICGRLGTPWEASEAADKLAAAQVDLVVNANLAFPNGQVFLTLATHPQLSRTPLAVIADPEPEGVEWATNAWCGVIMNNFVAKQLGRAIVTLAGPVTAEAFQARFARLLRVARAIKCLRKDYLCRFGDAPSGFHSATGDQVAFASVFGTRVDTVDLTAVMETIRSGRVSGYLGESSFSDADVQDTVEQMGRGRRVEVGRDMLLRGAKLYHAYRAIIRANGYTSAAFRCWPEHNEPFISTSACMVMGLLLGNGELTAAGCEGDWPTAVVQTIGTLLSGKPAACLDFVNYTAGSEIIQLGHCGMGICGQMAPDDPNAGRAPRDAVVVHPVLRQIGMSIGPTHVGQFKFGPKTGLCIRRGPDGKIKILSFLGESTPSTEKGVIYSATDVRVQNPAKLDRLILEHGFPHHLAVALDDVSAEVRMLCEYLGVEHVSPNEE
jgi:L-fucose isomerase-like protein